MALSKNNKISIGGKDIVFENCYIKIVFDNGTKNKRQITVMFYDNKENLNPIGNPKYYEFIPDVSCDSDNFIKQGYEYLKTLDEYKDAVDLLDEYQTA